MTWVIFRSLVPSTAAEKSRQKSSSTFCQLDAAAGNVVELVLEIGGEAVFDIALEEALEERGDDAAAILGDEALLLEPHIVAVLQHLEDRGIGRGPADAELLELLHQARLGVARRRLGEMLLRLDRRRASSSSRSLSGGRRRPSSTLVGIVLVLVVEREEAVEGDGRAGGAQVTLSSAGAMSTAT